VSDVILRINGTDFSGWTAVQITRSIEQVCNTFKLSLTERWDGADAPPEIRAGDTCDVLCDGERVITGYVDDALPSYDADQHAITVTGRSKPSDLVDCGLKGRQFKDQNLLQLATTVAGWFDISVRAECDVGANFARPAIEPGQTGFEFLEKHARQRAVRLISGADGALVIVRTGKTVVPTTLELGVNIRSASGRFSHRDRFKELIVLGQTAGTDSWNGVSASDNQGTAIDNDIRTGRRTVIMAENVADSAACKRRAEWQRNTAYGRGRGLTYTVSGWRHSAGLWQPNTLVPVKDQWMRLDESLLISSLQYIIDKDGKRTELQLMPPEAFDLIPIPAKDEVKAWS